LSVSIAVEVSAFLTEGAAEAAALLGGRQLDEVQAAHRAQQPDRRIAHLQQPQRVARRVVGHAVSEGRDRPPPQAADQELRQLEHAGARSRTLRREHVVAGLGRHAARSPRGPSPRTNRSG
jgi:hypothetical protein